MLILTRRIGETIVIGGDSCNKNFNFPGQQDRSADHNKTNDQNISANQNRAKDQNQLSYGTYPLVSVAVLGVNGNQVRLGIDAPGNVPVHRREVYERICHEYDEAIS